MEGFICVIDDDLDLNELITSELIAVNYVVQSFRSASDFFNSFAHQMDQCALIISDINLPAYSGYDICKSVRGYKGGERVPIILITGDGVSERRIEGIEAGADDLIVKPFSLKELLAKVRSLLEIRGEAKRKNRELNQAKRFISPSVANLLSTGESSKLTPHRACVSVLFVDIRGFTAFSERAEPEVVLRVLDEYYSAIGELVLKHKGTLGMLAGDGVMSFFNDPEPIARHQEAAARVALGVRQSLEQHRATWRIKGYGIDFGIGIAEGEATIGRIGFDRYWQYSVIGPVTNIAARLCQAAKSGEILVSQHFLGMLEGVQCKTAFHGSTRFKGVSESMDVHNILSID